MNLAPAVQDKLKAQAVLEAAQIAADTQKRREQTSKDDLCRLAELRKFPGALAHWSRTESSLTREQLDARHSRTPSGRAGTLADEADPYGCLAEIFNDYHSFDPQVHMQILLNEIF